MKNRRTTAAVILAAGKGTRMQSRTPKQYMLLEGKPVLFYSMKTFSELDFIDEIILVVNKNERTYCEEEIVNAYGIKKVKAIIEGGAERYMSVMNGIKQVGANVDYVMIHDSARPLITRKIIQEAYEIMLNKSACVVGVPVKDTIKQTNEDNDIESTLPRNTLWSVQTPQCFKKEIICNAYNNMNKHIAGITVGGEQPIITDDAMVVEIYGSAKVHMVKGEYTNIKITTPEDTELAKLYLNNIKKNEA